MTWSTCTSPPRAGRAGNCGARNMCAPGRPIDIGGRSRTAIAWTTSASVVSVIEMVRAGALPQQGFLKQEEIPFAPYLATRTGQLFEVPAA